MCRNGTGRKCTLLLLTICLMLISFYLPVKVQSMVNADFAGGSGTQTDPYLIASPEQLYRLSEKQNEHGNAYLSSHFRLEADIDFTAWDWDNKPWLPIGTDETYPIFEKHFQGTFDGNGHVIIGLKISNPTSRDQGMFGVIGQQGLVKNVSLEQTDVIGKSSIGGLAGNNFGTILASSVSGNVSGDMYVGGLVGFNGGNVQSSDAFVTVNGQGGLGGLVGYNTGRVSYSFAQGNVTGTGYQIGGLLGMNYGLVEQAYASGNVEGYEIVGGLVGENLSNAQVDYVYATGEVSRTRPSSEGALGNLVGRNNNNASISHAYWNTEINDPSPKVIGNNQGEVEHIIGLTAEQMTHQASYTWLDFNKTWIIAEGVRTPELKLVIVRKEVLDLVEVWAGTAFSHLPLPNQAYVQLNNKDNVFLNITWDNLNYDATKPGTYVLLGTLDLASEYIGAHSDQSIAIQVQVKPLAVPQSLSAITRSGQVTLTWAAVEEASGYMVYHHEGPFSPIDIRDWQRVVSEIPELSYTVTGLSNNATHWFAVSATNNGAESEPSITKATLLNDDAKLTAIWIDGEALDDFHPETGSYQLDVAYPVKQITVTAAVYHRKAEYLVKGQEKDGETQHLQVGNNFIDIEVTAENKEDRSTYVLNVKRADDIPQWPVNSKLEINQIKQTSVNLTWPSAINMEGIREYTILVNGNEQGTVTANVYAYAVTGLTANTTYQFSVKAIGATGVESSLLNATARTTPKPSDGNSGGSGGGNGGNGSKDGTRTADSVITNDQEKGDIGTGQASLNRSKGIQLTDISDHWAENIIKRAIELGLVVGYPDGTFKPDASITRAEFIVMLARVMDWDEESEPLSITQISFTDFEEIESWMLQAIFQAVRAGITVGYSDGSFRPHAPISRAELAVMSARALNLLLETNHLTEALQFTDVNEIPIWAQDAVVALRTLKIIEGRGDNMFFPNEKTTRAEAVAILIRILEQ